jgi:hypothetical protein
MQNYTIIPRFFLPPDFFVKSPCFLRDVSAELFLPRIFPKKGRCQWRSKIPHFQRNKIPQLTIMGKNPWMIIGCFRSEKGAENYRYIASLRATCRLQGKNGFEEFEKVLNWNCA